MEIKDCINVTLKNRCNSRPQKGYGKSKKEDSGVEKAI